MSANIGSGQLLTVEGLMSGIYDDCGNPSEDKLSPSQVLGKIFDRAQMYRNEMGLTDECWSLQPKVFTVQANVEDYQVPAPDFGRPFFAETYDSTNPRFRRRQVDIARPQDRLEYSSTNEFVGTTKHSARVFTFRNIGTPQPIMTVDPIPTVSAEYRLWYESILLDVPDLDDVPMFLQQFFPLLKVAVVVDVLPWCGLDDTVMQNAMQTAMARKDEFHDIFDRYVQEAYHATNSTIKSACSSRMSRGRRSRFGGI